MGSFLNALNYKIDEKLFFTNIFNGVHLFMLISLGKCKTWSCIDLFINIYWKKFNLNKKMQLISGLCILIAVIVLIIYIDKQDKNQDIE